MASDAATLAVRREALLRRSAELRSSLIDDASAISSRLQVVDKVTTFLRSGNARAALWGGALLLLVIAPSRVLKVSGRAAIAWSLIRKGLPLAVAFWRGSRRD